MYKIEDEKPVLGGLGDKTVLESVSISLIPQKKGNYLAKNRFYVWTIRWKPVLGGLGDKTVLKSVFISIIPQKKGNYLTKKPVLCIK